MPTSTPWGVAQQSESYTRGIMYYSTASHGGYHLSPTRNMVVPEYMRSADGWYEQDCAWAIAATIFPEAFVKIWGGENILKTIKLTLLNWYPAFYEQFYNVKLKEGESHTRDRENFYRDNADNYIVTCATGKEHHVEVSATLGGTANGNERTFLIKTEEYQNRSNFGFVIDLSRHIEI